MDNNEYFANLPTDEIGSELIEKTEQYYRYIDSNGYIRLWQDVYHMFYNGYFSKGDVLSFGQQGEKRKMTINDFASIIQHIKVLTTDQRPVFEPMAVNTDYKSMTQTSLARSLLDYYMKKKRLERVTDHAIDYSLQSGEGYIVLEWDAQKGKTVGEMSPEEEEEEVVENDTDEEDEAVEPVVKREGDLQANSFHPIDMVRDWYKDTVESNEWYIIRKRINKWEYAARYPKFKDDITAQDIDSTNVTLRSIDDYDFKKFGESDQTYIFIFRHDKTAAVPNGRQVEFLCDGTVVFDGDLPYEDLGIYRMMPQVREGTNFGYTVAFDMLLIQKAIDMLDSTIITNQNAFGVQNIVCPKGSGVTTTELTEGLNKIEYAGDRPPEPLKLLSTAKEIFEYKAELIQRMETISGVNSVARGNPDASLRSGNALALVQSMAIQFNSGLQNSYAQVLEEFGTGIINVLKKYAYSPRVALIAGVSKKYQVKSFKGADLELIDRVMVDMGHPMSKTAGGRIEQANMMLERGFVKTPEQYLEVQETGRLEPLTEGNFNNLMRVRSENEVLMEGGKPQMLYTDSHHLDIKEHVTIISSPDVRQNEPDVVTNTLTHINEHIQALRSTDPGILMINGQQPIPSPMNSVQGGMESPMVPPQNEELTPDQGMIGNAPPGGPEAPPSGGGNTGPQTNPGMPSMPTNPLTNKTFDNDTGGL